MSAFADAKAIKSAAKGRIQSNWHSEFNPEFSIIHFQLSIEQASF